MVLSCLACHFCLFGIFSLVTIMARTLYPTELPVRQASWYIKEDATFSDALAAVRRHLWSRLNYDRSPQNPDLFLIPQAALFLLWNQPAIQYEMGKVQPIKSSVFESLVP